jgi:hypothetical protein
MLSDVPFIPIFVIYTSLFGSMQAHLATAVTLAAFSRLRMFFIFNGLFVVVVVCGILWLVS